MDGMFTQNAAENAAQNPAAAPGTANGYCCTTPGAAAAAAPGQTGADASAAAVPASGCPVETESMQLVTLLGAPISWGPRCQFDGRVSLKLGLIALGSLLVGYIIWPIIALLVLPRNDIAQAIVAVTGPFFSIAVLLICGGTMFTGGLRAFFKELHLGRFPLKTFFLWGVPLALALAFGCIVITSCWQLYAESRNWIFGVPPTEEIMSSQSCWQAAALAVTALIAAPFYEEILFRRVLFGSVCQYFGKIAAYVVTAFAFGLMHMSILQLPGFLFMASIWQFMYLHERNLWTSIILHFFNNVIAVSALLMMRYQEFFD